MSTGGSGAKVLCLDRLRRALNIEPSSSSGGEAEAESLLELVSDEGMMALVELVSDKNTESLLELASAEAEKGKESLLELVSDEGKMVLLELISDEGIVMLVSELASDEGIVLLLLVPLDIRFLISTLVSLLFVWR